MAKDEEIKDRIKEKLEEDDKEPVEEIKTDESGDEKIP